MISPFSKKCFSELLSNLLQKIQSDELTKTQFLIILEEARIKFISQQSQRKFWQLFHNQATIPKKTMMDMLQLKDVQIIHNFQQYTVALAQQLTKKEHNTNKCFHWWKQLMQNKYGSSLNWFQKLVRQKYPISCKLLFFKERIKEIIANTSHKDCCDLICNMFPKNKRNEIEWSTFMAVVRRKSTNYYKTRSISTLSKTVSRPISRAFTDQKSTRLNHEKNYTLSLQLFQPNSLEQNFQFPQQKTPNHTQKKFVLISRRYHTKEEDNRLQKLVSLNNIKINSAFFRNQ